MDYRDLLSDIVNEISIGGQEVDTNDGDGPSAPPDEESQNTEPSTDNSSDTDESADEPPTNDAPSGGDEPADMPPADDTADGSEPSDMPPEGDDEPADMPPGDDGSMDMDSSDMGGDDGPADTPDGDGSAGDYSDGSGEMSADGGGGDDYSDGSEESEGDAEGEDNTADGEQQEDENSLESIKKIEEELFSSLSPEQIAIKNSELKGQFIELYTTIGSTLVRINDIPKSEDNIDVLKFVTDKLLELQDMVNFNVTTAYATRTYIENNIIYQQCIATLNAIADIIENIPKPNGELQDEEDEGESIEDEENSLEDSENNTETNTLDISDSSASTYQEESVSPYNTLF